MKIKAQTKVQKRSKHSVEEASGPAGTVATTGCPWWGARPVVEGCTVVRPGGAEGFCRFRVALRLPAIFAIFCLYNAHVPGPNEHLIHFIFFLFSPLDFRIVLERERGSGEDLRGFHVGR